jgi:MOSC domain-containing protein YiiM
MNKLGKVASVLIGKKRPYAQNTISAINKQSQSTRQQITELGIVGDERGDPIFHGGVEKTIHIYPSEHYEYWREELGIKPILQNAGAFGENISSVGLTESDICINDVILIGTTLLQVFQGRMPCWKLNVRCEEPEMTLKLQETLKTGWYFRVLKEGDIGIGDDIVLQMRSYPNWSLSRIMKIIYDGSLNSVVLKEMLELPLVDSWNKLITKRIELGEVENWDHRLYG